MCNIAMLKKIRQDNRLTQQQVADCLHVERSTYAYYECGHTRVSIETLVRLAHLYRVSIYTFLEEQAMAFEPVQSAGERFQNLDSDEQKLIVLYRSGDAAQRGTLLSFAETAIASSTVN